MQNTECPTAKRRVWQLAKEAGTESKNALYVLRHTGYTVKSPSSSVDLLPTERHALVALMRRY